MQQPPAPLRFGLLAMLVSLAMIAPTPGLAEARRIVFIAGEPSHGYGTHEFNAGGRVLRDALREAGLDLEVTLHQNGWPSDAAALEGASAIVLFMDGGDEHPLLEHRDALEQLMDQGVGLMLMHYALEVPAGPAGEDLQRWLGGYYESGFSTNPHWSAQTELTGDHAIARGVTPFEVLDEWYFNIRFAPGGVTPILRARPDPEVRAGESSWPPGPHPHIVAAEGRSETLMWALDRAGGGRGVGFTGGHFQWNWGNDDFRKLVLNAIVWVAGGEVPASGVTSRPLGFAELEAGLDSTWLSRLDWLRFDPDETRRRFFPDAVVRPGSVPTGSFHVPPDLEVSLFAESPLLYNPTNIDIDAAGRVWVAEGWNYREYPDARPEGDRIVVLEDRDGDGRAEHSHVFVQDPELVAPLGLAVIGNRVVVSQPPHLIVYTDVDGDLRFDPQRDRRENLLSGFLGRDHDHSLHSVTVGPDGWWYANTGNRGGSVTDRSGRTFHFASLKGNAEHVGQASDDGHVHVGGAAFRFRPDGRDLQVIGHNFRNSYEQAVTSHGDVFQADNDDGSAARTSWLMEHGNLGFSSQEGRHSWVVDRRPGQSPERAHWRQDDPGVLPAGDIYGAGAPAGMVFNEGGGLGERYRGLLLSADTVLNTVLAYKPRPQGAGFALDRFSFVTTNPDRELGGTDPNFAGGWIRRWFMERSLRQGEGDAEGFNWTKRVEQWLESKGVFLVEAGEGAQRFRPSDVAIGTDGALYIADWLDARVGGHAMYDSERLGAIYRVAPKGSRQRGPELDLATLAGQVEALRSPAVNVRAFGFDSLRARGSEAVAVVLPLLDDSDPYLRARAVWLLAALGGRGQERVVSLLESADENLRLTAFRALRRHELMTPARALPLALSDSPVLRREAALAMRDVGGPQAGEVLEEVARRLSADEPWALEALGLGAHGREGELYLALREELGPKPAKWSAVFARIAWRLHPREAVSDLREAARATTNIPEVRRLAVEGLAFAPEASGAEALLAVAGDGPDDVRVNAGWWLRHIEETRFQDLGLAQRLPRQPDSLRVPLAGTTPEDSLMAAAAKPLPPAAAILAIPGASVRGETLFRGRGTCSTCHTRDGEGGVIGPDLSQVGLQRSRQEIVATLLKPTSGIMPSAEILRLAPQEVADLVSYLADP